MKVERIVADAIAAHPLPSNDKIQLEEKGTYNSDAVSFDSERREPGANPKFKKPRPTSETIEEETEIPAAPEKADAERKIDVVV